MQKWILSMIQTRPQSYMLCCDFVGCMCEIIGSPGASASEGDHG